MSRKITAILAFLVGAQMVVISFGASARAQQRAFRVSEVQMQRLLGRIETRSREYRTSLEAALNRSRFDSTRREDNINQFVADFVAAVDRLNSQFNNRRDTSDDARQVLDRAGYIDSFMQRNRLDAAAERDWRALRADLDVLSGYYRLNWRWNGPPYMSDQSSPVTDRNFPGRRAFRNALTGTYRLDTARSQDVWTAAQRATRGLSSEQRERLRTRLTRRLDAPDTLAIDRQGRNVTIASSKGPQITIDADGRDRIEQTPNGRTIRVNSKFLGDQLIISRTGERGNDFRVTFDPVANGRQLRVTRSLDVESLSTPVVVTSVYDKSSDVAELDLYREATPPAAIPDDRRGPYPVATGTDITAILNESLSTRQAREGDRFTLNVVSPPPFEGAVIEGQVVNLNRSGRLAGRAEMSLKFDRIRMRNGDTGSFDGYIESITTPNGEDVRIDSEGTVREDTGQGQRTATRSGIGAALGALIGAVAGGGKGAAIGAVLGAGAGAGSVYIQGRDDLDLPSGTRIGIRAVTPRYSNP